MSATGGLAHEATYIYKRLASLLSRKWGDEYLVWAGYGVPCHFPYCVLLFNAFVVPVPPFDTMLWLLHQWT